MTSIIQYAKDNPHVVAPVAFTATTLVLAARAKGFAALQETKQAIIDTGTASRYTSFQAFCSRVMSATSNWHKKYDEFSDKVKNLSDKSAHAKLSVSYANKQKWISIGLAALSAAAIVGSYFLLKPESE